MSRIKIREQRGCDRRTKQRLATHGEMYDLIRSSVTSFKYSSDEWHLVKSVETNTTFWLSNSNILWA